MRLNKRSSLNISVTFGISICVIALFLALSKSSSNSIVFINFIGLMIVIGGIIGTSFIMHPIDKSYNAMRKLLNYIRYGELSMARTVYDIFRVANVITQKRPIKEVGEIDNPRLYLALEQLVSGVDSNDMFKYLSIRKDSTMDESLTEARHFLSLGKLAPGFGLLGTVIGLIIMLYDIGSGGFDNIGPAMAFALTSTLYGILFANALFIPTGEYLAYRAYQIEKIDLLIIDGLIMIKEGKHPLQIRNTLKAYLPRKQQLELENLIDRQINIQIQRQRMKEARSA